MLKFKHTNHKKKKTITTLLLILGLTANAQKDNYISVALGSDPTGHIITQFSMVAKNVDVSLNYDVNKKLDYRRYSFGLGYHVPLFGYVTGNELKTTFIPSIEPSLIDRKGDWGGGLQQNDNSSHLSVALNLAFQWELSDSFRIETALNLLPRTDLKVKYPADSWSEKIVVCNTPVSANVFFKVVYKIKSF